MYYMTIFYTLGCNLYVNVTNRCPCSCLFCLRESGKGVGSAESLWLPHEPDLDEIKAAFDLQPLADMTEIVFCGYGEPMERADVIIAACEYIKSKCSLPVRLNTSGLAKLINPCFDMSALRVFDCVSVSLNADDEQEYLRLTRAEFGSAAYSAMLEFAREAKNYTDVVFTVVDVIGEERIQSCRKLAESMDIPLKIRHFVGNNESYS
jgi:TatD family-associated radical SAM protein